MQVFTYFSDSGKWLSFLDLHDEYLSELIGSKSILLIRDMESISANFLMLLVFYYWDCVSKTLIRASFRNLLIFIGSYRSSGFVKKDELFDFIHRVRTNCESA